MIVVAMMLATAAPPAVAGRWITPDGASLIEVGRCGATTCGRIARFLKAQPGRPASDVRNPDPARRAQPLIGLPVLSGFVPAGDHWNGRAYDPRAGRSYRAELRRDGARLMVKGCVLMFCRVQAWRRTG